MRWWMATTLLATTVGCDVPSDESTFEVCAEVRETADRVPVNLLLSIDRSGSMLDGDPVAKWEAMTSALTSFVELPEAQALQVAVRVWPAPDGCNDEQCDAMACGVPQVGVDSLAVAEHRKAILDLVAESTPDKQGRTPMSAALEGARDWASLRASEVPDEQVAIALLTDGIPNGCDESIDAISSFAKSAYLEVGAPTYVMGIEGSRESDVDQIAFEGGTGSAILVGDGSAESELLEALQTIGGSVLSCSYDFPAGAELDPARIRVEIEIDGDLTRIPRVDDETGCDDGGFFLTRDGARITLCDATCEQARDTERAEIDIAIGCVCETNDDCPDSEVCDDNVCVPGDEVPSDGLRVQGGATTCQTAPGLPAWLAGLVLLAVARRRDP